MAWLGIAMHYDVAIIGAGMSGLAAGTRLAYFDKQVCIFERHKVCGGLNSFYRLAGRSFDVGLHAVTNFSPPRARATPLAQLLRQLRLDREVFDLCPQRYSEIRFPGCTLRFTNDFEVLSQEVRERFPREMDNFLHLVAQVRAYDDFRPGPPRLSARKVLGATLRDPLLIDMLLCPMMYYGNPEEHDMDFTAFVTLFKSIFLEGLARPRGGVRTLLLALVKKYRSCGGKLRMGCGVRRLLHDDHRVAWLELDTGERVTADVVLSSAGYVETLQLCSAPGGVPLLSEQWQRGRILADPCPEGGPLGSASSRSTTAAGRGRPMPPPPSTSPATEPVGRLSFFESLSVLDRPPRELGLETTIIFFNDSSIFTYARPRIPVDVRSGVICCPNNFERHDDTIEGLVRLTSLANYDLWAALDETAYVQTKRECYDGVLAHAVQSGAVPDFREHVVFRDMFTPRTIQKFTGHLAGAVYGSPHKTRDGRTPLKNLFLCGTDQGFLGVIGAMMSGIAMANRHILSAEC